MEHHKMETEASGTPSGTHSYYAPHHHHHHASSGSHYGSVVATSPLEACIDAASRLSLNNSTTFNISSSAAYRASPPQQPRSVHWAVVDDVSRKEQQNLPNIANSYHPHQHHPYFNNSSILQTPISMMYSSTPSSNYFAANNLQVPGYQQSVPLIQRSTSAQGTILHYTPAVTSPEQQPVTYLVSPVDKKGNCTAADSSSLSQVGGGGGAAAAAAADTVSAAGNSSTTSYYFGNENAPHKDPFETTSIDKHSAMDWSKELTEDQIAEYYDAFCFFDRDNSGSISTHEIAQVLISIGQATSEIEVREMLTLIDSNDSGSIDFPEFLKVMAQQRRKKEFLRDVRQAFRIFDKDGNGFITAVELRQVMTNMLGEKMSDDEVEALIFEADLDGDGQINFDEFVQFMFGYFEECKPNQS